MKIKNLMVLMALSALPMAACSNATGSGTNEKAAVAQQEVKSNLAFLDKLGLDASKLTVVGDEWGSKHIGKVQSLEDKQILALLPMVARMSDPEAGIEGGYYIEAVKPLKGGHTMVFYVVEYGDGGNNLIGIYDKGGKMTDFMDLGNWGEFYTIHCNDEMTQGQARITESELEFNSLSNFEIDKDIKLCDWTRKAGQESLPDNFTKKYWEIETKYSYNIDAQGHISLIDSKTEYEGEVDGEYDIYNDICEISRMPKSDTRRIDLLNDKIKELDQKLANHEMDFDVSYNLQAVVNDFYMQSPQELLMWIYKNRNTSNKVVTHFEELFASGWHNKSLLVSDIEQMKDAAAKKYLSELTSQWGPRDAVG